MSLEKKPEKKRSKRNGTFFLLILSEEDEMAVEYEGGWLLLPCEEVELGLGLDTSRMGIL